MKTKEQILQSIIDNKGDCKSKTLRVEGCECFYYSNKIRQCILETPLNHIKEDCDVLYLNTVLKESKYENAKRELNCMKLSVLKKIFVKQ